MAAFLLNPRVIAAIALFAALGFLQWKLISVYRLKQQAEIAEAKAERAEAISAYQEAMADRVGRDHLDLSKKKEGIRNEVKTVYVEVPKFIPSGLDNVPVGFVRLHDHAWGLSSLPNSTSEDNARRSDVSLSDVILVNAENAGTCRELQAEVAKWREWYERERAEYERKFVARKASSTDERKR